MKTKMIITRILRYACTAIPYVPLTGLRPETWGSCLRLAPRCSLSTF